MNNRLGTILTVLLLNNKSCVDENRSLCFMTVYDETIQKHYKQQKHTEHFISCKFYNLIS